MLSKAQLLVAAIVLVCAAAAPYKLSGLNIDTSSNVVVSAGGYVIAGLVGILLYKAFLENEKALKRRLERVQVKLDRTNPSKPVRIWVDGCFDLMHFGHANAFRQAKALGDQLIVGVNPSVDIVKYKGGPPVMNDEERRIAVEACRFVDEVVENAPYEMTEDFLQVLFTKYKIDYIVHGDDPCLTPDGRDVFESAKKTGRFHTIKRTEGVSTTEIMGRMLGLSREHHQRDLPASADVQGSTHAAFTRASTFLPTSRRFAQFGDVKPPKPGDRVVYVDGTWDMFHAGHIEFLKKCREQGDYLIVGIHSDDVSNQRYGSNYPVMNLHERVLSVLSCKYVDDALFGAPWKITNDLLTTFNVQVVCHGQVKESRPLPEGMEEPYEIPRKLNMLKLIQSPMNLKTEHIVQRVMAQRELLQQKYDKKSKSEQEYYSNSKVYVQEL